MNLCCYLAARSFLFSVGDSAEKTDRLLVITDDAMLARLDSSYSRKRVGCNDEKMYANLGLFEYALYVLSVSASDSLNKSTATWFYSNAPSDLAVKYEIFI